MILGEIHPEQAEFGIARPVLPAPAIGGGDEGLALLEAVGVEHEPVHAVLEEALVFGEIEIHCRVLVLMPILPCPSLRGGTTKQPRRYDL